MATLHSVLFAVLLAPGAADAKLADALIGKWQGVLKEADGAELQLKVEFFKDGTLKAEMKHGDDVRKQDGKYKVIDEKTLETAIKTGDKEEVEKVTVVLDKDKLTVTNSTGRSVELMRLKTK
jgi:uncharacterized protein (TIGR03066 family)